VNTTGIWKLELPPTGIGTALVQVIVTLVTPAEVQVQPFTARGRAGAAGLRVMCRSPSREETEGTFPTFVTVMVNGPVKAVANLGSWLFWIARSGQCVVTAEAAL